MKTGDKITFHKKGTEFEKCVWIPETSTATIQKIYKNGRIAIALHAVGNMSEDNMKTIHIRPQG